MDDEIYDKMIENLKNHPERFGQQHYFKIEDGEIHEYSVVSVYQFHYDEIFLWFLVDENGEHVRDYAGIEDYGKTVFFRREDAEAELERIRNEQENQEKA